MLLKPFNFTRREQKVTVKYHLKGCCSEKIWQHIARTFVLRSSTKCWKAAAGCSSKSTPGLVPFSFRAFLRISLELHRVRITWRARAYNGGLWGRSPSGSPGGRATGGGQRGEPPWSWKPFCFCVSKGSCKFAKLLIFAKVSKSHSEWMSHCLTTHLQRIYMLSRRPYPLTVALEFRQV